MRWETRSVVLTPTHPFRIGTNPVAPSARDTTSSLIPSRSANHPSHTASWYRPSANTTRMLPRSGTVNWPVAREQLKGILSPAQIEQLGLFVERETVSARYMQLQSQLNAEFRSKSVAKQK